MKFIPAKHFTIAHREAVDWIVIHATQGAERPRWSLETAKRFAGIGQEAPMASAHYAVDPVMAVQMVRETDVAFHCPKANRRGIGIELCGRADQTPEQWADDGSSTELSQAAAISAAVCVRWGIPAVKLSPSDIVHGQRGIAGHVDFSEAFQTPGGHRDPGPSFPWGKFMDLVRAAIDAQDPR